MKLSDLVEMTMLSGEVGWEHVKGTFDVLQKDGKYVGDIDGYKIYSIEHGPDVFYGIMQDNEIVSAINFRHTEIGGTPGFEIGTAYTKDAYRQNDHPKRILFHIKHQKNTPMIDYGSVSPNGIRFWKSLGRTGRFQMSWYNTKSGEKEPYNYKLDTYAPSKYRKPANITDWKILLENDNAEKHNKLFTFESEYSTLVRVPYVLFPFNIEDYGWD